MLRTGKVLNLHKFKRNDFFARNRALLVVGCIFVVGTLISAFTYKASGQIIDWKLLFEWLFIKRAGKSFFSLLLFILKIWFTVLVIYFLFGGSITGVVFIPLFAAFTGYLSGGISAYLYSEFALKGVAFNALIIIPPCLIYFITSFFAAHFSFDFSYTIVRLTVTKGSAVNISQHFKDYCEKYLLFLLVFVGSAVFDTVLSFFFVKLFDF